MRRSSAFASTARPSSFILVIINNLLPIELHHSFSSFCCPLASKPDRTSFFGDTVDTYLLLLLNMIKHQPVTAEIARQPTITHQNGYLVKRLGRKAPEIPGSGIITHIRLWI